MINKIFQFTALSIILIPKVITGSISMPISMKNLQDLVEAYKPGWGRSIKAEPHMKELNQYIKKYTKSNPDETAPIKGESLLELVRILLKKKNLEHQSGAVFTKIIEYLGVQCVKVLKTLPTLTVKDVETLVEYSEDAELLSELKQKAAYADLSYAEIVQKFTFFNNLSTDVENDYYKSQKSVHDINVIKKEIIKEYFLLAYSSTFIPQVDQFPHAHLLQRGLEIFSHGSFIDFYIATIMGLNETELECFLQTLIQLYEIDRICIEHKKIHVLLENPTITEAFHKGLQELKTLLESKSIPFSKEDAISLISTFFNLMDKDPCASTANNFFNIVKHYCDATNQTLFPKTKLDFIAAHVQEKELHLSSWLKEGLEQIQRALKLHLQPLNFQKIIKHYLILMHPQPREDLQEFFFQILEQYIVNIDEGKIQQDLGLIEFSLSRLKDKDEDTLAILKSTFVNLVELFKTNSWELKQNISVLLTQMPHWVEVHKDLKKLANLQQTASLKRMLPFILENILCSTEEKLAAQQNRLILQSSYRPVDRLIEGIDVLDINPSLLNEANLNMLLSAPLHADQLAWAMRELTPQKKFSDEVWSVISANPEYARNIALALKKLLSIDPFVNQKKPYDQYHQLILAHPQHAPLIVAALAQFTRDDIQRFENEKVNVNLGAKANSNSLESKPSLYWFLNFLTQNNYLQIIQYQEVNDIKEDPLLTTLLKKIDMWVAIMYFINQAYRSEGEEKKSLEETASPKALADLINHLNRNDFKKGDKYYQGAPERLSPPTQKKVCKQVPALYAFFGQREHARLQPKPQNLNQGLHQ